MTTPLACDVAKACQLFLFCEGWIEVRDGNDTARALFDTRHRLHILERLPDKPDADPQLGIHARGSIHP